MRKPTYPYEVGKIYVAILVLHVQNWYLFLDKGIHFQFFFTTCYNVEGVRPGLRYTKAG
jgi:hypothetical protein